MPQDPGSMYRWRTWTAQQRKLILQERQQRHQPAHSPPHIVSDCTSIYLITAACFEHAPFIGKSDHRLADFSYSLCDSMRSLCRELFAWVVLPNHYHVLADVIDLHQLLHSIGQLHGRTSFQWNGEDDARGRQTWCKAAETVMKSESHFYATRNYVFHNPVHHGYCRKWTDWPFSNVTEYLDSVGHERAMYFWRSYPLYDFGKNWDSGSM